MLTISCSGELGIQADLKLQNLLANNATAGDDFFHDDWSFKPFHPSLPTSAVVECDPRLQKLVVRGKDRLVFVEYKPFQVRRRAQGPSEVVINHVSRLAALLSVPNAAENGFCALECIGVVQQSVPSPRFAFVLALPLSDASVDSPLPTNLARAIASKTLRRPSLGERFKLARSLTETLLQFHSVNWVHKSFRSENVLIFPSSPSPNVQAFNFLKPFLVGFEFSRSAEDRSSTEQDDVLERNLYRHPDRWGPPEENFTMIHDVYALGAVLLEVGLWRPLVSFEAKWHSMSAPEVRKRLIQHAEERLPHYMGFDYTNAVIKCLVGDFELDDAPPPSGIGSAELIVAVWDEVVSAIDVGAKALR